MTSSLEKLRELHTAHEAAGATKHLTLMSSALKSGAESVCAAVLAHVEADTTDETRALATIARDLDSDRSPPTFWAEVSLARFDLQHFVASNGGQAYMARTQHDLMPQQTIAHHIATRYCFRREPLTCNVGAKTLPVVAKLLIPAIDGVDAKRIECFAREIRLAPPNDIKGIRSALLAAAAQKGSVK